MIPNNLNKGLSFSYPYESPLSMWRRHVSANRLLSRLELYESVGVEHIKGNPEKLTSDTYEAIISLNFPKAMRPEYLIWSARNLGPSYYNNQYTKKIKQCPECAACGYHTD